jgi:hypothetical protein
MTKHNTEYISYEVTVQEDEDSGDLLLPIPPALLAALDWKEGDEVEFDLDDKGNYVIRKANK